MDIKTIKPFIILFTFLISTAALNADNLKSGKIGISGHFDLGRADGDPSALICADLEYGFFEHFSAGAGWTYVDGYAVQEKGMNLFIKGYAFGSPADIFTQAGIQICKNGSHPDYFYTLKAGVEWQTPWYVFIAADAAAMFDSRATSYIGGFALGMRF